MLKRLVLLMAFASLLGCISVPQESVQLSYLVGERIKDMQVSHEAFVTSYFDLTREQLNTYVDHKFTPLFLENFVRQADLMGHLTSVNPFADDDIARFRETLGSGFSESQKVVVIRALSSAFGDGERGEIVLEFAEAALKQIESERKSLLEPLRVKEAEALRSLRASYTELIAMQATVTAHLQSIRTVKLEQDKLLTRLNLLKKRDAALDEAVRLNEDLLAIIAQGQDVEVTIDRIKCTIKRDC